MTVVWAAGNDGGDGSANVTNGPGADPTPGIMSVANYDDAGTGSRDNDLDSSSSRGKDGAPFTYPDISAPGANITSACRPYLPICATGLDTADQAGLELVRSGRAPDTGHRVGTGGGASL